MGFHLGSELDRIYHGGPYTVPAVVNRFTVADVLGCPPRKIPIFRGGRLNRFTAAGKSARRDK